VSLIDRDKSSSKFSADHIHHPENRQPIPANTMAQGDMRHFLFDNIDKPSG
jgi:hypothetical protein